MEKEDIETLFRSNLKALREEAQISQSELARRAGFTPGFICDFERGRRSPRLGTIAALAEALGVSPATLLSTVRYERAKILSRRALKRAAKEAAKEAAKQAV